MLDRTLYDWTDSLFDLQSQPLMTLDQADAYVQRFWAVNRTDAPPKVLGPRNESRAETNGLVIHLPLRARCIPIILHEIAHIIELRSGRSGEHTTEFKQTLCALYRKYFPHIRI